MKLVESILFLFAVNLVCCQSVDRSTTCLRLRSTVPPAGTKCSVAGSLASPSVARDFTAFFQSDETCRDACLDFGEQCLSYSYQTNNRRCRLFTKSLDAQGYKTTPQTANVQFWSKACWYNYCTTSVKTTFTQDTTTLDDGFYIADLPFQISFYGQRASTVYMSANGFLGFSSPTGAYVNVDLPVYGCGSTATCLPGTAILAFWDDLYINPKSSWTTCRPTQSMSYTVSGVVPERIVKFNWKAAYAQNTTDGYIDVDMEFYERDPDFVILTYNNVGSDQGSSATVGGQSQAANKFATYSFNQPKITRGLKIYIDPSVANVWKPVPGNNGN